MTETTYTYKSAFKEQAQMLFGNGRILFHIIFWMLFFFIFVISKPSSNELNEIDNYKKIVPLLRTKHILTCISVFGLIYSYLLIVIPLAFIRKYNGIIRSGIIATIIIWQAINKLLILLLIRYYKNILPLIDHSYLDKIKFSEKLFFSLVWFFFALYYFVDLYQQQKQLNKYSSLLSEKIAVEKAFLQSQINPHFLFNTLNNIYSLAINKNKDGVTITKQLKSLLHYMLYECKNDKVSLEGEIEFLKNYIGLEKIRNKRENLKIEVNINNDLKGYEIAPLLLINFLENAFKHGVKSNIEESFVKLNVSVINNQLHFDINNSVPKLQTINSLQLKENSGIGLENVKRRLAILYPKKHSLKIGQSETIYNTYLSINL